MQGNLLINNELEGVHNLHKIKSLSLLKIGGNIHAISILQETLLFPYASYAPNLIY